MIRPSQHIALLLDQAAYFRRMGNHPGEVASLKAAARLRNGGHVPRRDVIRLPSTGTHPNRRQGGLARAASLTPERRKEIARVAAKARWSESA